MSRKMGTGLWWFRITFFSNEDLDTSEIFDIYVQVGVTETDQFQFPWATRV